MSRIKMIRFAPLVVFFGVVVLLGRALSLNPNELPLEKLGKPLPAFELPLIEQPNKTLTQTQLEAKPALVHLWATWCGVCQQEHDVLLQLKQLGVSIIGINYMDDPEQAKTWLLNYGNPYQYSIADLNGKYGLELGAYGTPETYVIDSEGKLRYRFVGAIQSSDIHHIQNLMKTL